MFLSVDGFDSHLYNSGSLLKLKQNQILLFQERSNWSDAIQVLDLTVFAPYSKHEKTTLQIYRKNFNTAELTQWEFPYLYKFAMERAQTEHNIKEGFRKSGIFPSLTFSEWRLGPGRNVKLINDFTNKIDNVTVRKRKISDVLNLASPPSKKQNRKHLKKQMALHYPPTVQYQKQSPKKDLTGLSIGHSKVLNTNFRINKLKKFEYLQASFTKKLAEDRQNSEVAQAESRLLKAKRKAYRKSISHISSTLADALYIAPNKSATIGKIRKYLVDKGKVEKKNKMQITENNIVLKWGEFFPNGVPELQINDREMGVDLDV